MDEVVTKIRYWYDRTERAWVVQAVDKDENQIGDCQYDGLKSGRDFSIRMLKKQYNVTTVEKLKATSR